MRNVYTADIVPKKEKVFGHTRGFIRHMINKLGYKNVNTD